ncbi:MAG: TIGR02266 family protein, partial [Myxococcota bacterium]
RELKRAKLTSDIPVLAISSDYREEHHESLKRLGAVGYLNKKIPLEDIMFRINRVLYPEKRELRMSPRVEDNIFVRYQMNGSSFSGYSFNISSGGLFIRTISPPPEDTKVRLSFSLPRNGKLIRSTGVVTWRNEYRPDSPMAYPPGIGVKFTDLPRGDRHAISRHILQRLS